MDSYPGGEISILQQMKVEKKLTAKSGRFRN